VTKKIVTLSIFIGKGILGLPPKENERTLTTFE